MQQWELAEPPAGCGRTASPRDVSCPGSSGHRGWGPLGALAKHFRGIYAAGIHSPKKSLKLNSYILIRYPALPKLVIKCLLFHAH